MADSQQKIGELLIERGLIKADELKKLADRATQENKGLLEVLQEEKAIFPEALAQIKAEILEVPYVDLEKTRPDESAMADISRKAAATYRFIAFETKENKILFAMEDPSDFQALEAVKFIARKRGLTPEIYLASTNAIDKALGGTAKIQAEIGGALQEFSKELEATKTEGQTGEQIERFVEEAPVTKVVAVIIRHAIEGAASDIHIEPEEKEVRVRYRIDGKLHTSLFLPRKVHSALASRIKILSNLKIDETRLPQDGRFSSSTDGRSFDFRVSIMPTTYGEKIALRILDKSKGAPSFDELGLIGAQQKVFQDYLKSPFGIILISGPTGAGKSTTLFTSLNEISDPNVNVVTLEDPVEYEVDGVNQTQVNPDIGLTFASGLRSLLRQDPDVIMVGEIRDAETAGLSVHAALTGHLVLSTIHTNDAIGTVPRLIDMKIDPFLLAASIRLMAAQRLVLRLCQECLEEVQMPENIRAEIEKELAPVPDSYKIEPNQKQPRVLYQSRGCPACQDAGSIGRLGIFEIVPVSRAMRQAIDEGSDYDIMKDIATREGYLTMRQDGLLKALAGKVHYEDVVRVTSEETGPET